MKRALSILLIVILGIVLMVTVNVIEKNNQSPQARYLEVSRNNTDHRNEFNASGTIVNINEEGKAVSIILNRTHSVQYEFLSYEIIDDTEIAKQTKYKGEFFDEGHVPDPNFLREYTDYSAMRRDYPKVDEYISSNFQRGMTAAEYQEFLEQHYSEYTTYKHPKTKYLFLRCRITNITTGTVEENISPRVFAMQGNKTIGEGDIICYFDRSQHTEGEDRIHSYVEYKFNDAEESLECVIGIVLTEDDFDFSEKNNYYVGFVPLGLDDYEKFNPSIDDGFICVNKLPKER